MNTFMIFFGIIIMITAAYTFFYAATEILRDELEIIVNCIATILLVGGFVCTIAYFCSWCDKGDKVLYQLMNRDDVVVNLPCGYNDNVDLARRNPKFKIHKIQIDDGADVTYYTIVKGE